MKYNAKYIRHSHYLTLKQVEKLFRKHEDYSALGLMPRKLITIDFEKSLGHGENIQLYLSHFLKQMREWHKRHRRSFSYIWVIESEKFHVGKHVHIVLYSDNINFPILDRMIARWLPFDRDDPTIKGRNVDVKQITNIDGLLRYICKGIDNREDQQNIMNSYQGYIEGNRWGCCRKPIISNNTNTTQN